MERSLVGDATGSRVAPIRPCEVEEMKGTFLPSTVFEAFNELIARNFCDGSASVLQSDAVSLMVKKGLNESEIFLNRWLLGVEGAYRSAGWYVKYCDGRFPSFRFTSKD